jgi:hypothetical protein
MVLSTVLQHWKISIPLMRGKDAGAPGRTTDSESVEDRAADTAVL